MGPDHLKKGYHLSLSEGLGLLKSRLKAMVSEKRGRATLPPTSNLRDPKASSEEHPEQEEELRRTQEELEKVRTELSAKADARELLEVRSRLDGPRDRRAEAQALGQWAASVPLPGSRTSSSAAAGVGPRGAVYIAPKYGVSSTSIDIAADCVRRRR